MYSWRSFLGAPLYPVNTKVDTLHCLYVQLQLCKESCFQPQLNEHANIQTALHVYIVSKFEPFQHSLTNIEQLVTGNFQIDGVAVLYFSMF